MVIVSKRFIKPAGQVLATKPEWNLALVKLEYQDWIFNRNEYSFSYQSYASSMNYTDLKVSDWKTGAFVGRVLNRGGWHTKDYFNYEVGAQVCCVYQEGENLTDEMYYATYDWRGSPYGYQFMGGGVYIAGSFFNVNDLERQPHADGESWRLTFPNGSEIFYKDDEGELHINIKGKVIINGEEIWLNG